MSQCKKGYREWTAGVAAAPPEHRRVSSAVPPVESINVNYEDEKAPRYGAMLSHIHSRQHQKHAVHVQIEPRKGSCAGLRKYRHNPWPV